MLNSGSDLQIFFDLMRVLQELFKNNFAYLFEVPNKNRKIS